MLISMAYAQSAGGSVFDQTAMVQFLPLVLIFVVFYFLLIRPQQQKVKQHKELIAGVRRGDRVVTGGGIIGMVTKVFSNKEDEVQVEIADGVRVRVVKSTIAAVTSRTEAAVGSRAGDKGDDEPEEEVATESDSRDVTKH